MNIQLATQSDYESCLPFDKRLTPELFTYLTEQEQLFIAREGEDTVGYLRLEYIWYKIPYISWINVREDLRAQGIGRKLFDHLYEFLKKKNFTFLLSSFQDNADKSQRWHKKMGFYHCGKIAGLNEDDSHEIFCKLDIKS
ncbi:MAG: hypothetical protein CME62_06295 [Halobacteriovoraceae bacterium]|nr:hypothetical protein [Halobacteriovoraceae bacterium]|tara:strand:+ start:1853 stop:2272 length:420 start_codon:yes stop_codon:yes gene_type:complete